MITTYEGLGAGEVQFVGYETIAQKSVVAAMLVDEAPAGTATQGHRVEVVLKETPFYPEGGGQVGDAGTLTGPNGRVRVEDTQTPIAGLIVHRGVVEEGHIYLGDTIQTQVDALRRADTARNHSGTHLLHAALRQVLGRHVRQAGSLVAPERLRFDFSHIVGMSPDELMETQSLANQKVRDNLLVTVSQSSFTQAIQEGGLGLLRRQIWRRGPRGGDGRRRHLQQGGMRRYPCQRHRQVGALFVLGESV